MNEPAVTWAAVGMTAVSNVALWIKLIVDRKRPNGASQLKDIKDTVDDTNGKLDTLEGQVSTINSNLTEVKTKVVGQTQVCADTRKTFSEVMKQNADRIFNHLTVDHGRSRSRIRPSDQDRED